MLEAAQKSRVEKGLKRDPEVQEQLDIWHEDLRNMKEAKKKSRA